jgi:hypothetical protein
LKVKIIRQLTIYEIIIIGSILLLFLSYFKWFPFANYIDDMVGLLFGILFIFNIKKLDRTQQSNKIVFGSLLFLTVIGLFSNLLSGVSRTTADILDALFSFWRIFFVYLGASTLLYKREKSAQRIIHVVGGLAKLFIIISFIFGILNFVGVVNMSTEVRYGIKNFCFYFRNPSQYGIFVGAALAFMIYTQSSKLIYEIMAIVVMFMTTKGMGIIIAATYIVLVVFSNRKKIKIWQLVLVGLVLIIALQYQLQTYLLNETAPRAILIRYGFVTAIEKFPLGGGFGTYGSNAAVAHYSPLYEQYGFLARKALSGYLENGATYLNDIYLGMIVGEFGFAGLISWMIAIYSIATRIFKTTCVNKKMQNIAIACFVCMCGMFVLAGSVKNAPGEILMMVICLFYCSASRKGEQLDEKCS